MSNPAPKPQSTQASNERLWWFVLPIPLAIALTGAWVGSTLAIFHDTPVWLAFIGSIVAFGVLPLLWELWADRDQVGGRIRDAILRSSFLSLVLVGVLIGTHADTTYRALAKRGDWFLAGSTTPAAESIRRFTYRMADGFEWLDRWFKTKAFADVDTSGETDPTGSTVSSDKIARPANNNSAELRLVPPGIPIEGTTHKWPLPEVPHRSLASIPEEAKASLKTLAEHFKATIPDEFERVIAIHDFIAAHVSYDQQGIIDKTYAQPGKQSAKTVFATGKGVCSGYAALFAALAKGAGLEAVIVTGEVRWPSDFALLTVEDLEKGGKQPDDERSHGWNAVKVGGRWHLVDVTWNDGDEKRPHKKDYLFIPPVALRASHRPDHDKWQLVEPALSMGDWLRSPVWDPRAFFTGVMPTGVDRSVMPRREPFEIEVENPYRWHVVVTHAPVEFLSLEDVARQKVSGEERKVELTNCTEWSYEPVIKGSCTLPEGRRLVRVFASGPGDKNSKVTASFIVE